MGFDQQYKVSLAFNNRGVLLLERHNYGDAVWCFHKSFKLISTIVKSLKDETQNSLDSSLLTLDELNSLLNESSAMVNKVKAQPTSNSIELESAEVNRSLSLRCVIYEQSLNESIVNAVIAGNMDNDDIVSIYIDDLDGQRIVEGTTEIVFETAMILFNFAAAHRLHAMNTHFRSTTFYSTNNHLLSQSKALYRLSFSILTSIIDEKETDMIHTAHCSVLCMIVLKGLIQSCRLAGTVDEEHAYRARLITSQNDNTFLEEILAWIQQMRMIVVASAA